MLFSLWLQITLVDSQIEVSITTTNLSPTLGDITYELQCNIVDFQPAHNRVLVWTKDNQVVSWDREIQQMFQGIFEEVTESYIGIRIYYTLKFRQILEMHHGYYKCLVADGIPTSFTEVASDVVQLLTPHFPPEGNPMCSPQGGIIRAVTYTILYLTCT